MVSSLPRTFLVVGWLLVGFSSTSSAAPIPFTKQPQIEPKLLPKRSPLTASVLPSKNPPPTNSPGIGSVRPQPQTIAQQSGLITPINPPQQILINNQSYNLPWIQWTTDRGNRIGIPDGVLQKLFNVKFLSTTVATQQPIAWFRPDTALLSPSAVLPVRFTANDRYLDVTDWLTALGWQVQIQGSQLTLTPPIATLKELRQSSPSDTQPQPQADRIVLELDRPTSYQIDAQSQAWVLRLDAQFHATMPPFKPNPSKKIASLSLQSEGSQTVLKLGIPITARPVVTQLNNPPRIVIDVGSTKENNYDILWQPGIRWRQQMVTVGDGPMNIISLELDPRTPGLQLRPLLPNPKELAGIAPLIQTAQQSGSIVAINGGFFNRSNQLPLGLIQIDGQVRSGPILNRGVLAWDQKGNVEFDRYDLRETATIGSQSFPLTHLNSAYVQAGIARYTPAWGTSYQTLSDNEIVMDVVGDRIITQTPIPTAGTSVAIPNNGYLLTFRSNRTAAATFTIGSNVNISTVSSNARIANAYYAIGGGPLLIKDRQIVLDGALEKFSPAFIKERAARSSIGRLPSGNLLIVSAQPASGPGGATLAEMAKIMQQLGAIDALNFDGGSSTTLYLGGLGGQILDRPSRSSARVHDAIGIFKE